MTLLSDYHDWVAWLRAHQVVHGIDVWHWEKRTLLPKQGTCNFKGGRGHVPHHLVGAWLWNSQSKVPAMLSPTPALAPAPTILPLFLVNDPRTQTKNYCLSYCELNCLLQERVQTQPQSPSGLTSQDHKNKSCLRQGDWMGCTLMSAGLDNVLATSIPQTWK